MEIIKSKSNAKFVLFAKFSIKDEENNIFIEDANKKESFIFVGNKKKLTISKLSDIFERVFPKLNRNYEIDVNSFLTSTIKEKELISLIIEKNILINGKSFSKKTIEKKSVKRDHVIISKTYKISNFTEEILFATQMNEIKYLQDMPANLCTTNFFTSELKKTLSKNSNINIKVLEKKELEKLGMNLILAVNKGSHQNTKVLVCEYNNNPSSKEKISIVGKGIIFDSGGYDIKRGKGMLGMKYDMSGAAIAAYILDTIAKLGLKKNVSIVLPITTNLVDSNATLPEAIITSMSGRTVEIANTDAEGRLILADGLTYASKILKADLIIDISTLTGSVLFALGHLYTGVWSTTDKNWKMIEEASKKQNEKVWRMPLDSEYIDSLSKKTFADTISCSNVEYSDCNIAAAWLSTFAEEKNYIHFDIAGTADIKEKGKAPMLKTIVEFIRKY